MSMMDHSSSSNRRISNDPIIYKKHILAQANMLSWTPEGHHKAMGLIEEILEVTQKYGHHADASMATPTKSLFGYALRTQIRTYPKAWRLLRLT